MANFDFGDISAQKFLEIWNRFDADNNGYIEGKELDDFFRHLVKTFGAESNPTDAQVRSLRNRFMSIYDATADGKLEIEELANMILPEDENFLLLFRRQLKLDNSVEFMKIWRKYDSNRSGFISAVELKNFLSDLLARHTKKISDHKLEEYTDAMMKLFDRNKDGRLDLGDMTRIMALHDTGNFLLCFRIEDTTPEIRKRDFEKIFDHYDVSGTGVLEGAEVDGLVKDMVELVRPSLSGVDLDRFRSSLMHHCDVNRDGKIQKSELALCLGVMLGDST
ncbi:secretagogin-like [Lethenteron reissneri]|uniref:secretagogin-like n=1 Tax=Lethenteron reissneri TaxID=7753 RepID=UPI002AB7AE89|nr:secretagogin-like [Lethenteron reissneri]